MEYKRMSTKDMLQYCDEALAWDQFGPVDIFFFESVKRILLGQCPAIEVPETDELADVTMPIPAEELLSYNESDAGQMSGLLEDAVFFVGGEQYSMSEDGKERADA